jgi:hypothetical protein
MLANYLESKGDTTRNKELATMINRSKIVAIQDGI